MALGLKDKRGSEYDDDWKPAKSLTPEELQDAEESSEPADSAENSSDSQEANSFPYSEETGRLRRLFGRSKKSDGESSKSGGMGKFYKRSALVGGGGIVVLIILAMLFLSSLKVVHFSEILSASGYSRLRGILIERTTQDIFDASVVRGDGEVSLRGRSIVDRIKMRNVENQLAELGREEKLRYNFKNGSLESVRIGDRVTSLDAITRELGFGESLSDVKSGLLNKLNPIRYRQAATIRYEFYKRLGQSMNETAGFGKRFVRNRNMKLIASGTGFKWSRWRQGARKLLGLKPIEAAVQDRVQNIQDTAPDGVTTGVEAMDINAKAMKNADKIKAFLEKRGGNFDPVAWQESVAKGTKTAAKIQDVATKVGTVTLILSLACMTNLAFDRLPEVAKENEEAASRMALRMMSARDQIKAGDTNSQAVGAGAFQLNGAEKSSAYAYATGQTVGQATDVPRITPSFSPDFINLIDKLTSPTQFGFSATGLLPPDWQDKIDEKFCKSLLSPEGAVAAAVIEVIAVAVMSFFSGGGVGVAHQSGGRAATVFFLRELGKAAFGSIKSALSTKSLATVGAFSLYGMGLELVVTMLGGSAFTGAEQGADYFERGAAGTNVTQNREVRSLYGRPLEPGEAKNIDTQYAALQKQNWSNKGVFSRYLAIENPYSLIGMVAGHSPSSIDSVSSMSGSLLTSAGQVFKGSFWQKAFGSIFSTKSGNKVFAANDPDFDPYYKNVQWGYSDDELEKMRFDSSFSIIHLDEYISDSEIQEFDKTIGPCFDASRTQYEVEADEKCKPDKLRGDQILRYRLYKGLDDYIAEDLSQDYSKLPDEESSSDSVSVSSTGIVGDIGLSSESVPCPAGTTDLGIATSRYAGETKKEAGDLKIRLCQILEIPGQGNDPNGNSTQGGAVVNSRVAPAWLALAKQAKAENIPLKSSSSFRLADSCGGSGDGVKCGSPRKSYHQLGVAIDLNMDQLTAEGSPDSCSGRARMPGNPIWEWLKANSEKYGIKQYSFESWHWDSAPLANRCGASQ